MILALEFSVRAFGEGIDLKAVWSIMTAVCGLAGIAGIIYGMVRFIDSRVTAKLHDGKTLELLARTLRPSVIFDSNGTVLNDLGAMKWIDSFEFGAHEVRQLPKKLVVHFNRYIGVEPLLSCLDPVFMDLKPVRSEKYSWTWDLTFGAAIGMPDVVRYRLELFFDSFPDKR